MRGCDLRGAGDSALRTRGIDRFRRHGRGALRKGAVGVKKTLAIVGVMACVGCAEMREFLGAAKSAADGAGEVADVLALGRAEQIRMKARDAAKSAEGGDEAAALRALGEAQAAVTLSILRELAEARATCGKASEVKASEAVVVDVDAKEPSK